MMRTVGLLGVVVTFDQEESLTSLDSRISDGRAPGSMYAMTRKLMHIAIAASDPGSISLIWTSGS